MTPLREFVDKWFFDVFTNGDTETLERIAAKDLMIHGQGPDEGMAGRENFKEWLKWYRNTFVDNEWTIHDVITEGDRVVARYSGKVTYKGGLLDIPSSNQRIVESGIIIFRIENNRIQELWCEMSDLQVMQQLGAFPK